MIRRGKGLHRAPALGDERVSQENYSKITGSLFRAYVAGLDALGVRAQVRGSVSPKVQQLIDQPPLHGTWLDGTELTEIFGVVMRLQGLEGIRRLGYEATRLSTAQLLRPLMRTALASGDGTPAAIFSSLDSICRPFFKGLRFEYTPAGPREGTLVLLSNYRMAPPSFAAWEGSLLIVFDECQLEGSISPAAISEDGHTGTLQVRW